MKILVVVGYCLKTNSSANLCHIKYIEGLLGLGHRVDLVTVSEKDMNTDDSMGIPDVSKLFEFDASLYDRKGEKKRKNINHQSTFEIPAQESKKSVLKITRARVKSFIRSLYGVYGTDFGWALRAESFKSAEMYDCVLSLAYPPVSHKVVEVLLKKRRLMAKKWIQVWEDPWFADLNGMVPTERIKKEESRIISKADIIYYVSPLTLMYQKRFYPESASKMRWQPLPSYYDDNELCFEFPSFHFGYFGDYIESVRNLRVFYEYAVENKLTFTICGNGSKGYVSTETVEVHPRMQLAELKQYENKTNVLVFVCNLQGGQIPGKIYQYAATNKYILFILDGSDEEKKILHDYFSAFDRFVFCENNEQSIDTAVKKILSGELPESYRKMTTAFNARVLIDKI